MNKWAYRTEVVSSDGQYLVSFKPPDKFVWKPFDVLGRIGWELVSVFVIQGNAYGVFKQPLPQEA